MRGDDLAERDFVAGSSGRDEIGPIRLSHPREGLHIQQMRGVGLLSQAMATMGVAVRSSSASEYARAPSTLRLCPTTAELDAVIAVLAEAGLIEKGLQERSARRAVLANDRSGRRHSASGEGSGGNGRSAAARDWAAMARHSATERRRCEDER